MKKTTCIYLLLLLLIPPSLILAQNDYDQDLHQYITIEAYYLLKNAGYNVPLMEGFLGTMNDDGNRPWQTSKITTGAYREDEEDVVFLHGGPCCVTVSHFWNADDRANGDFTLSHLIGVGDFKNAYNKAYLYKNGNWYDGNNNPSWIIFNNGNGFHYLMYRNGLAQFYKDGIVWYEKVVYPNGGTYDKHKYIQLTNSEKNKIVWEILGRMCHLLQDQTVPAHAHCDVHWPEGDCYEGWTEQSSNYTNYNRYTAGTFINPYDQSYGDPIRYLYYIANQLGDYWPSDPDCYHSFPQWLGDINRYNSTYGQGTYPILEQWYNELGPTTYYLNPQTQAGWNLNKAICLTASLMYWFAVEANLEQFHPTPTNLYIVRTPTNGNVYNGQIGKTTAYATGIGMWFNWMYKRCSEPPPQGNWYSSSNPLHGIWYNCPSGNYGNIFDIYNSSYNGQLCSEQMNPLPTYSIYEKVRACTNGGGCTGYITTNFTMWSGVPNGGGCPYVFTTSGDQIFHPENNILHKVEFDDTNDDITDKYLLRGIPMIMEPEDNAKLNIVIKELDDDINYFDYIKLMRVQHPNTTKIAVTENGNVVQYDSLQVISSDNALLNGLDVTDEIQYDTPGSSIVSGNPQDQMNIYFPNVELSNPAIIMEIEGNHIRIDPVQKDYAGNITINTNMGLFETNFSRRENFSVNIIEIPTAGEQIIVNNASIIFNRDFRIKYIALVDLSYEGFSVTDLPLSQAKISFEIGEYTIENLSSFKDYEYVVLDSTSDNTLHIQFDYLEPDPSLISDYVLEINGTYSATESNKSLENKNIISGNDKPKLYMNYPNPFNPITKIRFELPYKENVEIKIFNVLGQEIVTLINDILSEGFHEFTFDGSNLSSGIYFYRLKTDNYVESKKMLLIK